jgi:hypothetical protein
MAQISAATMSTATIAFKSLREPGVIGGTNVTGRGFSGGFGLLGASSC